MPTRKKCKDCENEVEGARGLHHRTIRCITCAKRAKARQTAESRPSIDRREEQRRYMRVYRRAHPGSSTLYVRRFRDKARGLPMLNKASPQEEQGFEAIRTIIVRLSIIAVELTGLIVILTFSVKHILDLWGVSW